MSFADKNTYPLHYNTNYIDTQFSFSNEVFPSKSDVSKNRNMICNNNIMLEPRLQEYLKKKKYYKQNYIIPCVSLEKEFHITNKDKKMIKDFLRGKKNLYDVNGKYNELLHQDLSTKNSFPSKNYRDNDPRVLTINKININEKKPINRGMFCPDDDDGYYATDMIPLDITDARDFENKTLNEQDNMYNNKQYNGLSYFDNAEKDSNGWSLNNSRFNPRSDPKIDKGIQDKCKYNSQYRIDPRNNYVMDNMANSNMDNMSNNIWGSFNNNTTLNNDTLKNTLIDNNILYNGTSYGNKNNNSYNETNNIDYDNKRFIPNVNGNNKRDINTSAYKRMPYMGNSELINSTLETELIRGMPHNNKSKSYGYRNPDEHYYQYINNEFQHPNNVVLPFPRGGEGTRQFDKGSAKNKYIEHRR